MVLYLVVLSGPKLGVKLRIHEGFMIGRKHGDLLLDEDPKVSSSHAQVSKDNKGQFILVDQDSANAILLNKRRVKKLALLPGVNFTIGSTQFRIIRDESSNSEKERVPLPPPEPPKESTPTPVRVKTWKEKLEDALEQGGKMISQISEPALGAFSPALMLDFIEGVQADQKITLGYGPREAGYGHLDVELWGPEIPERAFLLSPGPGSVQIRDLSNGKLLVNNRSIEVTFLEEGDIISIGHTKIKVRYL